MLIVTTFTCRPLACLVAVLTTALPSAISCKLANLRRL
jgi:hypothetical protein